MRKFLRVVYGVCALLFVVNNLQAQESHIESIQTFERNSASANNWSYKIEMPNSSNISNIQRGVLGNRSRSLVFTSSNSSAINKVLFSASNLSRYSELELAFDYAYNNIYKNCELTVYVVADGVTSTYTVARGSGNQHTQNRKLFDENPYVISLPKQLNDLEVVFQVKMNRRAVFNTNVIALDNITLKGVEYTQPSISQVSDPLDRFDVELCHDVTSKTLSLSGKSIDNKLFVECVGGDAHLFTPSLSIIEPINGQFSTQIQISYHPVAVGLNRTRLRVFNEQVEWEVELVGYCSACVPVSVTPYNEQKRYLFNSLTEAQEVMSGDYFARYDLHADVDEPIHVNSAMVLSGNGHRIQSLHLTTNNALFVIGSVLSVDTLYLDANSYSTAQVHGETNGHLKILKRLVVDRALDSSIKDKWTPISLPFIPTAIKRVTSTGREYDVKFGTQYMMYEYDSRAKLNNTSPWVSVNDITKLSIGKGYMVSTTSIPILRFVRDGALDYAKNLEIDPDPVFGENSRNSGWAFIGQPLSHTAFVELSGKYLVYDTENDKYVPITSSIPLLPTTAVLYQFANKNKVMFNTCYRGPAVTARADWRSTNEFVLQLKSPNNVYDKIIGSFSEYADPDAYEVGADLLKHPGVNVSTRPEFWFDEFNDRLCVNEMSIKNGIARSALGFANLTDDLVIALPDYHNDEQVWIVKNGQPIHELSKSEFVINKQSSKIDRYELEVRCDKLSTGNSASMNDRCMVYAQDNALVVTGEVLGAHCVVYNMLGVPVSSTLLVDEFNRIFLPSGVYLVAIDRGDFQMRTKVLVN